METVKFIAAFMVLVILTVALVLALLEPFFRAAAYLKFLFN